MSSFKNAVQQLRKVEKEVTSLAGISSLLHWDQETLMPKRAGPQRQEHLAFVSKQMHERMVDPQFAKILNVLWKNKKKLSKKDQVAVKKYRKEVRKLKRIPASHVEAFARLCSQASLEWQRAREQKNFALFAPYLEKIVRMRLKEAKLIDRKKHPYDVLLDEYEEGTTRKEIDAVVSKVKQGLIEVIQKIKRTKQYAQKKPFSIPVSQQKGMVDDIITRILPEKERRVVAESIHPFTTEIALDDVRLTTAYREGKPFFGIEAAAHEAGHALYELNIPPSLRGSIVGNGASMGIHESQSRLWENHVFKSREFWQGILPAWQKRFPAMKKVAVSEWYGILNKVRASLVRIESDEVTYNVHIVIRYEIERALCERKIKVKDLPRVWKEKYQAYLGVTPQNDTEGVLQDVHWAWGSFGYFPMYTFGNVYAAMLWKRLLREHPQVLKELKKGKISTIQEWLKKKVHGHGATFTAKELIQKVCKKHIDPEDFLQYIKEKYYPLYGIKEDTS